jgi:flagellar hook-associated protein FlgK
MGLIVDMPDMIDFQTSLQGMDRASASLDRAASRIAAIGQPSGDTVDLSTEMVALIQARNNFGANVKAAQTMEEVTQSLLNIVG